MLLPALALAAYLALRWLPVFHLGTPWSVCRLFPLPKSLLDRAWIWTWTLRLVIYIRFDLIHSALGAYLLL